MGANALPVVLSGIAHHNAPPRPTDLTGKGGTR